MRPEVWEREMFTTDAARENLVVLTTHIWIESLKKNGRPGYWRAFMNRNCVEPLRYLVIANILSKY